MPYIATSRPRAVPGGVAVAEFQSHTLGPDGEQAVQLLFSELDGQGGVQSSTPVIGLASTRSAAEVALLLDASGELGAWTRCENGPLCFAHPGDSSLSSIVYVPPPGTLGPFGLADGSDLLVVSGDDGATILDVNAPSNQDHWAHVGTGELVRSTLSSVAGDVDLDGHTDLVIPGRTDAGRELVFVHLGPLSGEYLPEDADMVVESPSTPAPVSMAVGEGALWISYWTEEHGSLSGHAGFQVTGGWETFFGMDEWISCEELNPGQCGTFSDIAAVQHSTSETLFVQHWDLSYSLVSVPNRENVFRESGGFTAFPVSGDGFAVFSPGHQWGGEPSGSLCLLDLDP